MTTGSHSLVRPRLAWVLLVLVAIASALVWRVELEWHGWAGLDWIGYFHWAVPAGLGMFLTWLGVVAELPTRLNRWTFLIIASLMAVALYMGTKLALVMVFVSGPTALPLAVDLGPDSFAAARKFAVAGLLMIPVVTSMTGRAMGLDIGSKKVFASALVFWSAYPVALALMWLLDAPGQPDAIHAIKTGYAIPLIVIGLGIAFVPSNDRPVEQTGSGAVAALLPLPSITDGNASG